MKFFLLSCGLLLCVHLFGQVSPNSSYPLTGIIVSENNVPVQGATVQKKGSFNEVQTDSAGKFEIQVESDDVLRVTAFSYYSVEISVEGQSALSIQLTSISEELGEVEITQKREKEEKNVSGGSGIRRALGYDGDQFREYFVSKYNPSVYASILKMPRIMPVRYTGTDPQLLGLGTYIGITRYRQGTRPPPPATIIIDDVLGSHQELNTIRPEDIENVTVIEDPGMVLRYKALYGPSAGGYILVDTKYGNMATEQRKQSLLATGNDYQDDAKSLDQAIGKPDYIVELESANSFEEAKKIFNDQSVNGYSDTLPYFLETSEYFSRWDQEFAEKILESLGKLGKDNSKVLKALAFHYEKLGKLGKATFVYQDLMNLEPGKIQSYRNLANIYGQTGKLDLANTLYKKMFMNSIPNMDFSAIGEIVVNEYRSFLADHKSKVDYSGLPSDLLIADFKKDVRFVFEWTNPLSEFEIQMVSPSNKFYSWEHSGFENKELIQSEIKNGYAIKEFVIDDGEAGEWLVNITNLGQELVNIPTYLKYTVYYDYGKPTQTKEIKVVGLHRLDSKVTLDNTAGGTRIETNSKRSRPNNILLYLDTSLGMMNRNLRKESRLLSDYLEVLTSEENTVQIEVIRFSDKAELPDTFEINSGNIEKVTDAMRSIVYNGASDFSKILTENKGDADLAILVSDGNSIFSTPESKLNIPVFTINSVRDANHALLNDLAFYSGGYYIDLSRQSVDDALKNMMDYVQVTEDYASDKELEGTDSLVYGVIHNESGPIQGARVGIKGTFSQVSTGSNGMYRIAASEGDVLTVNAFGMETKDTIVGTSSKIHIKVKPDGELLDEVKVSAKRSDGEIIDTPFENKKKGSVGYSLSNKVTADQIGAYQTDLFQVLQKMPGVIVEGQTTGNPRYKLRRTQNNSLRLDNYPAIVLDGMVIDQATQQVPFVNPQQIKSITILQSANSAIRYGQLAANGAIVIEMKTAEDIPDYVAPDTLDPVTGNEYSDSVLTVEELISRDIMPAFVKQIREAPDFETARKAYLDALQQQEVLTVTFFTIAAEAMRSKNPEYAVKILNNISELAPDNVQALRTLAFYLESFDADTMVTPVYERLVNIDPTAVQSYLDLARNYKVTGSYDLAATLYKQMVANNIPNVDFTEAAVTVFNEFKQLVALHKSKIDYTNIPESILRVGFKKDIRIVVEWNEPLVDFDLQFVSPKKKFFQISHSVYGDTEQIKKEIKNGVFIKEFEVEDAEKGEWIVNLKFNGKSDKLNPMVLKYTMYRNYGLPNEKRVVKAIRLTDLPEKASLDSFIY